MRPGAFGDSDLVATTKLLVVPAEGCEKCVDSELRSLVLLVHHAPLVIIEYDDATGLHHWPGQDRVAVDVSRHVAAVDIGEIESAPGNAELRQYSCRAPLDLLDTIRQGREIGIELKLGLGCQLGEIRIEVMLDAAGERIDAN